MHSNHRFFTACSAFLMVLLTGPTRAQTQAHELHFQAASTEPGFEVSKVELQFNKKDKPTSWKISGTCSDGTSISWPPGSPVECQQSAWSAELPHQAGNRLLKAELSRDGKILPSKWLAVWIPTESTENSTRTKLEPTAVSQVFSKETPIEKIEMTSSDKEKLVIRNYSPALDKADKVELFVSSGTTDYQVNTVLEKDQYQEIPWSLWGPKITKLGTYDYRVTVWLGEKDHLGGLNQIEFYEDKAQHLQLRHFLVGVLFGYQPTSSGSIFSLDARWTPRYQFNERWAVRWEVALPILKESGGGLFPALDLVAGPGYSLSERLEVRAGFGWQHWFLSTPVSGVTVSAGASFKLNQWRKALLNGEAIACRYSVLFIDEAVHYLSTGVQWSF